MDAGRRLSSGGRSLPFDLDTSAIVDVGDCLKLLRDGNLQEKIQSHGQSSGRESVRHFRWQMI